jgi:hypothetical protein
LLLRARFLQATGEAAWFCCCPQALRVAAILPTASHETGRRCRRLIFRNASHIPHTRSGR